MNLVNDEIMPTETKKATANGTATKAEIIELTNLTANNKEADALIKRYALFGTATGLIPTAGLDVAAATAVQTKMIGDLARIYGFTIDDQLVRTVITTGLTSIGGRVISAIANTVAQSFTPLKIVLGGATSAAVSGFLTYETGKIYQACMQEGRDPAEIGVIEIVNHIVAQIQEGKWDASGFSLQRQLGAFGGEFSKN